MSEQTAIKKQRALPRVWAKFYRLTNKETFFTPNGDRAIKVAFCGFRRYARPNCFVNDWGKQSRFEFIAPWKRVKTEKFRYPTPFEREVAKTLASSSPFTDLLKPGVFPSGMGGAGHEGAVPPGAGAIRDDYIDPKPYDVETLRRTPYRGSVGVCAPSIEQTGPSA